MTTPRDPACKRGIATNVAVSLARSLGVANRVCVIDGDPFTRDVTTRFAVRGPAIEDFAGRSVPTAAELAEWDSPRLSVVPCAGDRVGLVRAGMATALPKLTATHDVVIVDLPGGPMGPTGVVGDRLDALASLLLAVTPVPEAVAAAQHFFEQFEVARACGDVGSIPVAVVCTGDEGSCELTSDDVGAALGIAPAGRVHQWWGRAVPNLGFGPTLPIPELDDAVRELLGDLGAFPAAPVAAAATPAVT